MSKEADGNKKAYLGDSVYAQWDGYHVILTTENGSPEWPSNTIHLEPDVLHQLEVYVKRVMEKT